MLASLSLPLVPAACEKKPPPPKPLTIEAFMAGEDGDYASAYLVSGETEAVLIDAMMLKEDAEQLKSKVAASGKALKLLFFTHAHPDHIFGATVIHLAFRDARVAASPAVAAQISRFGHAMLESTKKRLGEQLPDSVVVPSLFQERSFIVDGREVQILRMGSGESRAAVAFYIPANQAIITGDTVYHQVHPWLVDGQYEQWLLNLELLKKAGPIQTVYPGHGEPAGAELLDVNVEYIRRFVETADQVDEPAPLLAAMKEHYPEYRLVRYLERSVQARFPASR